VHRYAELLRGDCILHFADRSDWFGSFHYRPDHVANRQETQKPQYVSDSHEYQELQSLKISSQGVFIPKIVQYRLSDHLINIEGVYKKT